MGQIEIDTPLEAARRMLDIFAGVGAERFHVPWTNSAGDPQRPRSLRRNLQSLGEPLPTPIMPTGATRSISPGSAQWISWHPLTIYPALTCPPLFAPHRQMAELCSVARQSAAQSRWQWTRRQSRRLRLVHDRDFMSTPYKPPARRPALSSAAGNSKCSVPLNTRADSTSAIHL
ncbi:MAG: hypothetical protein JO266_00795 [Acidobacteria bacterium]|nr:hypothetical protein [Acidobacteriota bacterium]